MYVTFKSREAKELRRLARASEGGPSTQWIQRAGGGGDSLCVKRRIAMYIAAHKKVDLYVAYLLLWEMLDLLCDLFSRKKATVAWMGRGKMTLHKWAGEHYGFRPYPSFRRLLSGK